MPTDPVFAEDRLVPIAAGGGVIAAFDSGDGGIRVIGGMGGNQIRTGPGRFAVLGVPAIHEAAIEGTKLRVAVDPFVAMTNTGRAYEFESDVPAGSVVVGLVPGDGGWVVVRTSASRAQLFSVRNGDIHDVPLASDERIVAVWCEGRAIVQSASGWRIGESALRPGVVISTGSCALIARVDPKGRRGFLLVDALGGENELTCPKGWRVDDAVVRGREALVACLHPQLGYALWDGSALNRVNGTPTLFSMGGDEPVIRTTGVATGSLWRTASNVIPGAIPARPDLNVDPQTIDGLPTVLITGDTVDGLVVALHGGPDSLEWDDLRYGGLYRAFADAGLATLIVNAPGSRGFSQELHEAGWDDWTAAAHRLARAGRHVADEVGAQSVALLGVSFGAWLAVQAANVIGADRVVAASPVLDLAGHLRVHGTDPEYDAWARRRFGADFERAVAGDVAGARCQAAVTVVLPKSDRVVDPARTAAVAFERGWQVVPVPEGHAPTTAAGAAARWAVIEKALTADVHV